MITGDIEKAAEKRGRAPHLVFGVEPLEVQHGRDAVETHPLTRDLKSAFGVFFRVDDEVPELLGQCDEVAFGVDDRLLHPGDALFEKPAEQMGFAGTGIALHQQARGEKFLEVQSCGVTRCGASNLDGNGHIPTQTSLWERRVYQSRRIRSSAAIGETVESG